MDAEATDRAVAGSDIVYLTVGLPMDSAMWETPRHDGEHRRRRPQARHEAGLLRQHLHVPAGPSRRSRGETPFEPHGRKASVRAQIATRLQEEMDAGRSGHWSEHQLQREVTGAERRLLILRRRITRRRHTPHAAT